MASLTFSSSLATPAQLRHLSVALPPKPQRKSRSVQAKIREIFMLALSSTMTEGKIVSWIKSEGNVLSKRESVFAVEFDKADMDVEAFYDGIFTAIVVGSAIGILVETEQEIAEAKVKAQSKSQSPASSSQPEPPSPKVETPVAVATVAPPPTPPAADGPRKIMVTPYAKKCVKQHKVDIDKVLGTGPFRRITPEDVEKAARITLAKSSIAATSPAPAGAVAPVEAPVATSLPEIPGATMVPFTTMQATVSKNMVKSLNVAIGNVAIH